MKILHIAPIGLHAEGIGTVLSNLIPEQISLGHDIKLASLYENKIYCNLDIQRLHSNSDLNLIIKNWIPDIVIFHSMFRLSYIRFAKLLKQKGIPYAIQMHGALSDENYKKNHFKKMIANYIFFNKFLSQAKALIFLSNNELERNIAKNLNKNHIIIPNGCNKAIYDFNRKEPTLPLTIVFIGRLLIQTKGLDVLIDAIKILKKRKITYFHFLIYSNEDDLDVPRFKILINDLQDLVEYKGAAYGEKKFRILHDSDIFIQTSRSEGMPMGVLEALSYGVPCLLTPGTNMSEIVTSANAGWKTELNSNDIVDQLLKVKSEYMGNALSYRKSAYRLSQKYNWHTVAQESIDKLYNILK